MIQGVVIHLVGKLPLLVDMREVPAPSDQSVLCTNVRTRDGKRPQYIEDPHSWFLIPIHEVTIIELPASSVASTVAIPLGTPAERNGSADGVGPNDMLVVEQPLDEDPLEPDEELLARIRQL